MKTTKFLLIVLFGFCLTESYAQFRFGASAAISFAQIEKDNLSGLNKFGYNVGLNGGYLLSPSQSVLVEFRYNELGSKRSGEELQPNSNKKLTAVDLNTISVFFGYSFMMGDSWDGTSNYRFTAGLNIHNTFSSHVKVYSREELISKNDPFEWQFVALRFGPGINITKQLQFDLIYEHTIANLKFDSSIPAIESLHPFQLNFTLSYYL